MVITRVEKCRGCSGMGDHIDLEDPFGPRRKCRGCDGWGIVIAHMDGPFPVSEKQEFAMIAEWVDAMIGGVA